MTDLLERVGELSGFGYANINQQLELSDACKDYESAIVAMDLGSVALINESAFGMAKLKQSPRIAVRADTLFKESFDIINVPGEVPQIVVSDKLVPNRHILP